MINDYVHKYLYLKLIPMSLQYPKVVMCTFPLKFLHLSFAKVLQYCVVLTSIYISSSKHTINYEDFLKVIEYTEEAPTTTHKPAPELHLGGVVYRRYSPDNSSDVEYLIVKIKNKHHIRWVLPKAQVKFDLGLSEKQLFLRKLQEKVGLRERDVNIVPGFVKKSVYRDIEGVPKNINFYLVELIKPKQNIKSRLATYYRAFLWLPYQKAYDILRYKDLCDVLETCNDHLKKIKVTK